MNNQKEVPAIVIYKGDLAYYWVAQNNKQEYEARLYKFRGEVDQAPPDRLYFKKEGTGCMGDVFEPELIAALYQAVQHQDNRYSYANV